nr:phosphotransferase [Nocardioides luti]
MEGTVVALGGDRVAKVWQRRSAGELARLRTFYDAVGSTRLPFATPAIEDVVVLGDACASIEPRLAGTPLWQPGPGASRPTDDQLAAVVDVLAALAATAGAATPGLGALPVLEGEEAFDAGIPFEHNLAALVVRRVAASQGPLARALPDVEGLAARGVETLRTLTPSSPALVHGDLIPANVLVDDRARPTALLDFGFLSTLGDPAFDAAVAASVFDMYGPDARATEARLDAAVAARLGHPPERLGVHRAAYALVTATCFSASGSDGHFAWCVRMLQRDDVLDAVAG